MSKDHKRNLYNILLNLSRNIFFYKVTKLPDTFETRLYLMFFHFSILMIVSKFKGKKFNQESYDYFFHNIEFNLRENGLGDVAVNKKMKEFNKILYDILLKLNLDKKQGVFKINRELIKTYFENFNDKKQSNIDEFEQYFQKFYDFCFELPLDNMIERSIKFKDLYGST